MQPMNHHLSRLLAAEAMRSAQDAARRERAPRGASGHAIAIRRATPDDARDVARLAELDSAAIPAGTLLLGEVDGRLVAALAVDDGAAIADPFASSANVVSLRAQLLHQCLSGGDLSVLPAGWRNRHWSVTGSPS